MSKTYTPNKGKKNNWITRQWYSWLEVLLIRLIFPVSFIYFSINFIRFMKERKSIKNTLLSSQELVNDLSSVGFYLDTIGVWFIKFRTYALDNIQIITEQMSSAPNIHPETLTRVILSNIKEVLNRRGKVILENTSMKIIQPSDKVLLIRLHPASMASTIVSLKDMSISILIGGLIYISFLLIKSGILYDLIVI